MCLFNRLLSADVPDALLFSRYFHVVNSVRWEILHNMLQKTCKNAHVSIYAVSTQLQTHAS